jgi:hypothetical protein
MPQNPLDMLRDLYKSYAEKADATSRQLAQNYHGEYVYPERLPPHMQDMGKDLPPIVKPPMYRPQSEVLGGQEFANGVENFLTQIPEMRGRSPRIQHGPNDAVFGLLDRSDMPAHGMQGSNLNGLMTIRDKSISLNPRLEPGGFGDGYNLEETLGHELGHTVNVSHGPEMDDLENNIKDAFQPKTVLDHLAKLIRK